MRMDVGLTSPTNTSKLHVYVEQFSCKTRNWQKNPYTTEAARHLPFGVRRGRPTDLASQSWGPMWRRQAPWLLGETLTEKLERPGLHW